MKSQNFTTPPQKAAAVSRVEHGITTGLSINRACYAAGVSPASYLRWSAALAAAGGDAWAAFSGGPKPSGRPVAVEFTESDLAIARWHRLCKGSLETAIYFYCLDADASPASKAALRQIEERGLEKGKESAWPLSVRRAFHVTEDERNRFRGAKAAQNSEMVSRRGMIWIDEEGNLQDLLPGELWELDDYSCNQPFSYMDPATGALLVGRQILAAMDVCGAGWLGFDLIGRPRDAYRGEDIVRFIGRLFRAHGVPRFLRLERGSWDSSYIHGLEVEGQAQPWGALDHLCTIQHVWKSKGKGTLEGSFNPLQNWLAHAGRELGRHAGEFQESAKAWRQVKNAKAAPDPRLAGFWTQDQCASAHEEAARIMNGRPRERAAHGERVTPNDLTARLGWHTTPLPASEAWRLLPYKQRRVIRDGSVMVNPGAESGWPEMTFSVNGVDGVCLETGHAVLVAFDPADPAAGAYIANADTSARNRYGLSFGQVILHAAPLVELAPQIDLSGRRHGTLDLRRRAAAAAATEFRAVKAGAPNRREGAAFDGRGASVQAGNLPDSGRHPAQPAPTARTAEPVRSLAGLPRATAPAPARGTDAAALFGADRAAQLAALEAEAMKHL